jgi:serine/threonine protein phosphatase PrpC
MASDEDKKDDDITDITERSTLSDSPPVADEVDLYVVSHSLTNNGCKRLHNEDSYYGSNEKGIWVVADGMGGHNAGDFASQSLMQSVQSVEPSNDINLTAKNIEAIVQDINLELIKKASDVAEGTIIGATLAMLIANDSDGILLWAGDSRVYRIRNNELEQLTQDHSLVNDLIKQGAINQEDASSHPESNKITRAVGYKENLELDYRKVSIRANDRYIICSDGLTKELTDENILSIASHGLANIVNEELMRRALEEGGRDNITTITIDFLEE